MTIAAAYLTSEGVVLGADSSTTITRTVKGKPGEPDKQSAIQVLNHTQKVFEIGQGSRFGLATWGSGVIGKTSHRTIAALLGDWVSSESAPTVGGVVERLAVILRDRACPVGADAPCEVGYFVGGVNPDREPACLKVDFKGRRSATGDLVARFESVPLEIGDASFEGAPDYFCRVFHGVAYGFPEKLLAALKAECLKSGALPSDFDGIFVRAFNAVQPGFATVGWKDLSLRDAIDYVHTHMAVTTKALKFRYGVRICGGPLEVACISTDRQFRWARHKRFDSAIDEYNGDRQ